MKPLPHDYDVHLTGGPARYAVLSSVGIPDLPTAKPPDVKGPGDAWSPEHLLLAAVQTTFGSRNARLHALRTWDRERALRMLEKSEKHCLVSASLSTPIRVEPAITESGGESWNTADTD